MCLHEDGKYYDTEDGFAQVMETLERVLGEQHPDTLTSMAWLASTVDGRRPPQGIGRSRWRAQDVGSLRRSSCLLSHPLWRRVRPEG